MPLASRFLPPWLLSAALLGCVGPEPATPPRPPPGDPPTSAEMAGNAGSDAPRQPLEIAGDAPPPPPPPPPRAAPQVAAEDCSAEPDPLPAPFLGPAPPGLVAFYRFEELDGPVLDSSGRGHHGEATSSALRRGAPGRVGRGLFFAGGHVRVPASRDLDFSTAATIELWVRITPALGGKHNVGSTVSRGTGSMDDNVLMNSSCGNMQLIFSRKDVQGSTNLTSDCGMIPVCTWTHVAYVNDGRTLALYINGNLHKTGPGGFLGPLQTDLYIGRRAQGIFPFAGTIDEIQWWREARTSVQICADAGGVWARGGCQLRP